MVRYESVNPCDMTVVAWRIWYKDGRQITSAEATLADAPKQGIEGIVAYHPLDHTGQRITSSYTGLDWYVYDRDARQFHHTNDLTELVKRMHITCSYVFAGEWTTDEEIARINAEIRAALDAMPAGADDAD